MSAKEDIKQTGGSSVVVSLRLPVELLEKIDFRWKNDEKTNYNGRTQFIEKACRYYLELDVCANCGERNNKYARECAYCGRALPLFKEIKSQLEAVTKNFTKKLTPMQEGILNCQTKLSNIEYHLGTKKKENPYFNDVIYRAKTKIKTVNEFLNFVSSHGTDSYEDLTNIESDYDEALSIAIAREYLLSLSISDGLACIGYSAVSEHLINMKRCAQWLDSVVNDMDSISVDLNYIDEINHSSVDVDSSKIGAKKKKA